MIKLPADQKRVVVVELTKHANPPYRAVFAVGRPHIVDEPFVRQTNRGSRQVGVGAIQAADVDRRYKQILDSVRVRQRKLFRFSRILSQKFENSTEYNINFDAEQMYELQEALELSGHILIERSTSATSSIYVLASPTLEERQKDVQSILAMCYHAEERPEDPMSPYIIILKPEKPFSWTGRKMEVELKIPHLDLKTNRLRLVTDGGQQRLVNANFAFTASTGIDLAIVNEQRSNYAGFVSLRMRWKSRGKSQGLVMVSCGLGANSSRRRVPLI